VTAELRMSEGLARYARNDLPGALAALKSAAQLYDSVAIDAHAQLVQVAQGLGSIEQASGDPGAAQQTYDRGYALARIRFGDASTQTLQIRGARATNLLSVGDVAAARPELEAVATALHARLGDAPLVATARSFVCEADLELHDLAHARMSCDDALATAEHAFPNSPEQLSWLLVLEGRQRLDSHDPKAAIALFERALAATTNAAIAPMDRPLAQAYLAIALHETARDRARAISLADQARPVLARDPSSADVVARLARAFPSETR
jgi:tetratricopeptide (TPR) repeat protein